MREAALTTRPGQMPRSQFYVNGTLIEYCLARRPPRRALVELLLPLCQALTHLHAKDVIHSDIKPRTYTALQRRPTPYSQHARGAGGLQL